MLFKYLKVFLGNILQAGLICLICCDKLYTNALQKKCQTPSSFLFEAGVHSSLTQLVHTQFQESDFMFVGILVVAFCSYN